jgi:hypothetical protein
MVNNQFVGNSGTTNSNNKSSSATTTTTTTIAVTAIQATDTKLYAYPHIINPYLMAASAHSDEDDTDDKLPSSSPSSSSSTYYSDGLSPSLGSLITLNAEKALYRSIHDACRPDFTAESMIPFIHLDIESSLHLSHLLPCALHHIHRNNILGKLVWESTEIHQVDPSILSKVIILPIKRLLFDINETWDFHLKMMTDK